jgi:hypothetical protein
LRTQILKRYIYLAPNLSTRVVVCHAIEAREGRTPSSRETWMCRFKLWSPYDRFAP